MSELEFTTKLLQFTLLLSIISQALLLVWLFVFTWKAILG